MFRLIVLDILLKRRSRFVFSPLCLNRNDLGSVLQNKVDLAILVGVVSGFNIKLSAKLLQHIVFRKRPFELIIALQEDGAVVWAKEEELVKKEQSCTT